jgi:hypothetical protein
MSLPEGSNCRRVAWALICISSMVLGACGASPALRAARRGDFVGLKAALDRENARCKLDAVTIRQIAKLTADGELRRSSPSETMARIDDARACAHALSDSLEVLGRSDGDAGAAATLALLDGGADKDGDDRVRRYGASTNPLWRAVAARAAVGEKLGSFRRASYADPDERVRLAAFRAALETGDRADRGALLEAARLDPNPLGQALASRAVGAIADGQVVLALRDLYARADPGLRQSIVDGWGGKEAAAAGGIRELIRVAENDGGAPSIEAARVLLRFRLEQDAAATGTRALVRAMGEGLARDRVLAIMDAPADDVQVRAGLAMAARSSDASVRIAALSRLAESKVERARVQRELFGLAKGGWKQALYALARTGDRWAARAVASDLSSPDRETRLAAARLFIGIGNLASAADLLADADPRVRMTTACALLNARD